MWWSFLTVAVVDIEKEQEEEELPLQRRTYRVYTPPNSLFHAPRFVTRSCLSTLNQPFDCLVQLANDWGVTVTEMAVMLREPGKLEILTDGFVLRDEFFRAANEDAYDEMDDDDDEREEEEEDDDL